MNVAFQVVGFKKLVLYKNLILKVSREMMNKEWQAIWPAVFFLIAMRHCVCKAYQNLPDGPIDINSMQGLNMRIRMVYDGMQGRSPNEYYKGWKKDYGAGKNGKNDQ